MTQAQPYPGPALPWADDDRPIILEARCDACGRFVRVTGVWQEAEGGVRGVEAECREHGARNLPAHCYAVWWPGE